MYIFLKGVNDTILHITSSILLLLGSCPLLHQTLCVGVNMA
jgi:hypothetical protein